MGDILTKNVRVGLNKMRSDIGDKELKTTAIISDVSIIQHLLNVEGHPTLAVLCHGTTTIVYLAPYIKLCLPRNMKVSTSQYEDGSAYIES